MGNIKVGIFQVKFNLIHSYLNHFTFFFYFIDYFTDVDYYALEMLRIQCPLYFGPILYSIYKSPLQPISEWEKSQTQYFTSHMSEKRHYKDIWAPLSIEKCPETLLKSWFNYTVCCCVKYAIRTSRDIKGIRVNVFQK